MLARYGIMILGSNTPLNPGPVPTTGGFLFIISRWSNSKPGDDMALLPLARV